MKHLKIAMSLILATALFTACTKEKTETILKTAGTNSAKSVMSTGTQKGTTEMPSIAYRITTVPMNANSPLQWTGGYLENSALAFDAIMVNDARFKVSYLTNTGTAVKLFGLPDMDKVNVPPARYEDMTFTLKLVPGAASNGNEGALVLNGSFQAGDMKMPIKLIVDQPVDLSAKWLQGVSISSDAMYNTYLTLSMPVLSAGITTNMLNQATNVNGLITISASSNTAIYQKIIANLEHVMTAQFGTTNTQGEGTVSEPGNATLHPVSGNGATGQPATIAPGQ